MKYVVRHTSTFKRDYKLMLRRHMPVEQLHAIVTKLANGELLPPANRAPPPLQQQLGQSPRMPYYARLVAHLPDS